MAARRWARERLAAAARPPLPTRLGFTAGVHNFSAVYGGDGNFTGSTGNLSDTIEAYSSYTSLATSVTPVVINNPVTYTATVYGSSSAPSGTTPTGSVVFNDNGTLVSKPITASGSTWIAQYTTSYPTAGTRSVTAVYQGDANFSESGGGPLSESVVTNKTTSQISVSASANPAVVNSPVTFTLTVNAGATGTITLSSGNTVLASGSPNSHGQVRHAGDQLRRDPVVHADGQLQRRRELHLQHFDLYGERAGGLDDHAHEFG